MINVTQKLIELLNANSRTFRMKLVNGSEEYTNILNLKWFAALPSYLSIGNAICTCVECSAVGIPISIKGTYLDVYITVIGSDDEWVQIGTFKAEKPTLQNGVVSFSAYDVMNECSKAIFTHKLGTVTVGECYETVITTIENEIGTVSYVPLSSSVASLKINADMLCGYDCRNVLAYIAGYLGCNCVVNNTGSIEMRGFTACNYTLDDNRITEPELDDDVSDLEFLACSIDSDTKLLYGNNGEGFEFICPIMTQERLNEIGATMCASTSPVNVYRSGKIKHLLGDLRLQIGDVICLEHGGETHIIPISSIAFEFDGGLSADIEAFPLAEASSLSLAETLDFVSKQNANKRIKGITNYYLATSTAEGVTKSTEGWSEAVQTVSAEKKYLWNYEAIEFADGTLYETDPCIIGNFAADGRGISKITEYYATTSSTVAPEKKAFSTEVKTPTESLPYLWNYEKIDYSDGSEAYESDIRLIGVYSKNGDNGKTYYTWIKYADDESGTNMSDSPSGKNYVGIATNKTTSIESTTASDYTWSLFKGQGVISIKTQYYRSTSNTTQTGGSWSYDMPEWIDGTYLWKREVTTFENPSGTNYGTAVLDTSWDALGDLNKNLSATEAASKELNETLANALGLYVTEVIVSDTKVRYYHSKSPLASCVAGDKILVFNANGFGVCTTGWNGGNPQFTYGATFDGKAVWDILVANNISADNIEAGVIKSIASAAVQTKLNLNDGTMSFETGNTLVTIQGATTDSDGVERNAGLLIQDKTTNNYFGISLGGFAYMTAEYALAMIKYLLGSGPKPEDPYFSEVREQSIKTKDIHCQNIYVLSEGAEANIVNELVTMGSQVTYLGEALSALQEKYTALEEALGQQHEHTAATAVKENIVAPTCTEAGSYDSVVYCATCGEEISRQTVTTEATGHTDSNGDGYCDSCGALVGELTIVEENTTPVVVSTAKETIYLKFKPKYSGSYTFESLDQVSLDPDGYVFDANKTQLAYHTASGAVSLTYDNFVAGTVYYLGIKLYSGTGTVNVKVSYNSPKTEYTINTSVSPTGAGTVTGGGTFEEGTSGTVTATPTSGYVFKHWIVTLTDSGESTTITENPKSFTVAYNASFEAVFEAESSGGTSDKYTLKVSAQNAPVGSFLQIYDNNVGSYVGREGQFDANDSLKIVAYPPSGSAYVITGIELKENGVATGSLTSTELTQAGYLKDGTLTISADVNESDLGETEEIIVIFGTT